MSNFRYLLMGLVFLSFFLFLVRSGDWYSQAEKVYFNEFLTSLNNKSLTEVTLEGSSLTAKTTEGKTIKTLVPNDLLLGSKEDNLVQRMLNENIPVNIKESKGTPWYWMILINWGPFLFLIGLWIYFFRKSSQSGSKLFSVGKSRARKASEEDKKITFNDVAGIEESKKDLSEIVDFLKNPESFGRLGGKIPSGVLMIGPPGTGKTMLAKAVAGEAKVPFFSISGSDFVEMFVGVGASRVRDMFEEARKSAPCIVFIDEIDAVGRHRGAGLGSGHDEREQTLNQLLVEMDGFDSRSGIIVIAATNRMDILDPALLRPGRFDRQVTVSLPDWKGRAEILAVHGKKVKLAGDVDLSIIARGTPGFSGAELANLMNEAALHAAKNNLTAVDQHSLEWARDKIIMGVERKSFLLDPLEKKITAFHEAGHAIVSAFVEKADPIHKITIIPRGQALGLTAFLPEGDKLSMDKVECDSRIAISMGGRAAEEIIFQDTSTGAEGDFRYSTSIAYRMVCEWGMSEKLGVLTVNLKDNSFLAMDYFQGDTVSETTQNLIDEEVRSILMRGHDRAKKILTDNLHQLHALAEMLLEKETVSGNDFLALLKKPHAKLA